MATITIDRRPLLSPKEAREAREHLIANMHRWTCEDTVRELSKYPARVLPPRPVFEIPGVGLTWSDYFCGGGGSSDGIQRAGGRVVMAVNHWDVAIATHNYNLPNTDHDQANVARTNPRRYRGSDAAWFSPECTYWSVARGDACDYDDPDYDLYDDEEDDGRPLPEDAKRRSRMLMRDVVRFSRVHQYKVVVVENVPDILKWAQIDRWIADMRREGYLHKIITLNSAFAQALGDPTPQLRDRVYVFFWKANLRRPNFDKWLRPYAWCPSCQQVVRGIYNPKPGARRPMRYRAQYTYRCPQKGCGTVQPYALPASSVLDLSNPGQRIGDRKKPLAEKTWDRIAAGLGRYGRRRTTPSSTGVTCPPLLVPAGGTWNNDPMLASQPMRTRTGRENECLVTSDDTAMVVPLEGRPGLRARHTSEPLRTMTARHTDALVVPLRNHGVARPADQHPLVTVATGGDKGGGHQALVMRNNTARGDGGQMSTPVTEPLRTLTTAGHQSLLTIGEPALYAYDTGLLRPLTDPLPTQTGVAGDALVITAADVQACTMRMLTIDEVKEGTGFDPGFVLLGASKRNDVKLIGNAVTPPAAAVLAAMAHECMLGIDLPVFEGFNTAGTDPWGPALDALKL